MRAISICALAIGRDRAILEDDLEVVEGEAASDLPSPTEWSEKHSPVALALERTGLTLQNARSRARAHFSASGDKRRI
jgi:hypothetical protein